MKVGTSELTVLRDCGCALQLGVQSVSRVHGMLRQFYLQMQEEVGMATPKCTEQGGNK